MNYHTHFIEFLINRDILNVSINGYPIITVAWNIFLLIIPFFLCKLLISLWRKTKFKKTISKIKGAGLFFLWLIFAPNAAYVMTDVRHLNGFCPNNLHDICIENAWMIPFFFLYSIFGWITYVYLVNQMKFLINKLFGKRGVLTYLCLISPIFSLGILLGLVNRWNSWDLLLFPLEVLNGALLYLGDWTYFKNLLIYTFSLYILYFIGDILFVDKIKFKK